MRDWRKRMGRILKRRKQRAAEQLLLGVERLEPRQMLAADGMAWLDLAPPEQLYREHFEASGISTSGWEWSARESVSDVPRTSAQEGKFIYLEEVMDQVGELFEEEEGEWWTDEA